MSDGKNPPRVHIISDVHVENVAGNGFEAHGTVIASGISIKNAGGHGMVIGGAGSTVTGCNVDLSQRRRGRVRETAASVAAAVTAAAIAKAMGLN